MIVVPGRVLSSPRVTYSGKVKANLGGGASWNLRNLKFPRAATILPWAMLRIGAAAKVSEELLEKQYKSLTTTFSLCGLKSAQARFPPGFGPLLPELKLPEDESEINKVLVNSELRSIFGNCQRNGTKMLLVILPSDDSWLYERIKYLGDVEYGISPQHTLRLWPTHSDFES